MKIKITILVAFAIWFNAASAQSKDSVIKYSTNFEVIVDSIHFNEPVSINRLRIQKNLKVLINQKDSSGSEYTVNNYSVTVVTLLGKEVKQINSSSLTEIKDLLEKMKTGEFIMFHKIYLNTTQGLRLYNLTLSATLTN